MIREEQDFITNCFREDSTSRVICRRDTSILILKGLFREYFSFSFSRGKNRFVYPNQDIVLNQIYVAEA